MKRASSILLLLASGCAGSRKPVLMTWQNPNLQPPCAGAVNAQCQYSIRITSIGTGQVWTVAASQLEATLTNAPSGQYKVEVIGQVSPGSTITGIPALVTVQ